MSDVFDAYYLWLGIPADEQPPDHYRLLSIKLFEANHDVIAGAADRQMAHVRTFQSGKHAAESQKLLNELAAARFCLLTKEKRHLYDRELRGKLAAEKPPTIAQPAAAARLLTAQPLSPTAQPASTLGFDPLEQAPARVFELPRK